MDTNNVPELSVLEELKRRTRRRRHAKKAKKEHKLTLKVLAFMAFFLMFSFMAVISAVPAAAEEGWTPTPEAPATEILGEPPVATKPVDMIDTAAPTDSTVPTEVIASVVPVEGTPSGESTEALQVTVVANTETGEAPTTAAATPTPDANATATNGVISTPTDANATATTGATASATLQPNETATAPQPTQLTFSANIKVVRKDANGWEVTYSWDCPDEWKWVSHGDSSGASGSWPADGVVKIKITCIAPDGSTCAGDSKTLRAPWVPTRTPEPTPIMTRTPRPTITPGGPTNTPKPTRTLPPGCIWCSPTPTVPIITETATPTNTMPPPPTLTSTPITPTVTATVVTETSTPTATPTTPSTPTPQGRVVTRTPAPAVCPLKPILREYWNAEDGQWDVKWYNGKFDPPVFVANLTAYMDEDFRNPTIHLYLCKWAAQVQKANGDWEIRVYDFGMTLLDTKSLPDVDLVQPELVLNPDNKLLFTNDETNEIVETTLNSSEWTNLGVFGSNVHSLPVPGKGYRLAYTNLDGYLEIRYENGAIENTGVKGERPEWVPDGRSVCIRQGENVVCVSLKMAPMLPDAKTEVTDTFSAVAFDPTSTEKAIIAGDELYFTHSITTQPFETVLNSEDFGLGSDFGGTPLYVTVTAEEMLRNTVLGSTTAPAVATAMTTAPELPKYESDYTGPSIVEFLGSLKINSSFEHRRVLALQYGIVSKLDEYVGSRRQNSDLLDAMRK